MRFYILLRSWRCTRSHGYAIILIWIWYLFFSFFIVRLFFEMWCQFIVPSFICASTSSLSHGPSFLSQSKSSSTSKVTTFFLSLVINSKKLSLSSSILLTIFIQTLPWFSAHKYLLMRLHSQDLFFTYQHLYP